MKCSRYNRNPLPVHGSGDPRTCFTQLSPAQVLDRYGPPQSLLSSSAKMKKCKRVGVLAAVLYMTPGILCTDATQGCLAACLGHCSGRMQMPTHALCRDRRTAFYLERPEAFETLLEIEIWTHVAKAKRLGLRPAVRLNGSSDLAWEVRHRGLFDAFPTVAFFDYTKNVARMKRFLARRAWPTNYHLTFSAAPGNHGEAKKILRNGGNVAVVFWPEVPTRFWDFPVIDGDKHDARFLDAPASVVALTAKGLARTDTTGFTVRVGAATSSSLAVAA